MRELSKLARFFIICAAVFFVGLVCAIVGVATGGMQDVDKLADRYDWIQGGPGERAVTSQEVEDFHSIEVTGDADLWIVGKDFYKKASWLADQDILKETELDVIGKNKVCVIAGDKAEQPEISVEKGVLKIETGVAGFSGVSIDFSEVSWIPTILVCVPDEVLEQLSVSSETGDVDLLGLGWESASIGLNTGDISMEGVKSGSLTAETDTGDIELQGKLMGTTQAHTDTGDIKVDSSLAKAEYALNLKADTGDIEIEAAGEEAVEYEDVDTVKESGGPHKIIAETDTGDVTVRFASEL